MTAGAAGTTAGTAAGDTPNVPPEPVLVPPLAAQVPSNAAPAQPPRESLGARIGNWIGMGLLAIFFIRVAVALVMWCVPDFRMLPPSLPKLAEQAGNYLKIDGLKRNISEAALHGKVVIVDKDKGTLHPLMRGLPKAIEASTPDEVDFVIWVDSEQVPDPEHSISAVAQPTAQDFAAAQAKGQLSQGIPTDSADVPVYKAKWTVTVIDLHKKEIKATKSFIGLSLPDGELDFQSPPLSGQTCLFVDGKMAKGAEVLFGGDGRVFIGGKPLKGVIAPAPWDETLEWIGKLIAQ